MPDHPVTTGHFAAPVDPAAVAKDWAARGYSCHSFIDPPGQQWLDFAHASNEVVTVIDGRLKLTIGDDIVVEAAPGDEVFIPKHARHSVYNDHPGTTRWLFGYD